MKVFLFYRTDQWNSRTSEELVYIGTSKETSIKTLMKLENDPITKEQAEELRLMNQSQCSGLSYEWFIETRKINSLED